MKASYDDEDWKKAQNCNLYSFLLENYPTDVIRESSQLRLKNDHSVCIKRDGNFYVDFATGEGGSGVKLLTNHFGYNFVEAVLTLAEKAPPKEQEIEEIPETKPLPVFPLKVFQQPIAVKKYLCKKRFIAEDIVDELVDKGLIYQDIRNNVVFANKKRTWGERRGTGSIPFHRAIKNSQGDGFWSFKKGNPKNIYVCEACIDAISLYELKRMQGEPDGIYVAIGGAGKQRTIDKLKTGKWNVIIAVDKDYEETDAGPMCRKRNSDCDYIIPKNKDWNDDLVEIKTNKDLTIESTYEPDL